MDKNEQPSWQFGFGVFIGAMVIALTVTPLSCRDNANWKNEAVDHGCAEFYLDKNHKAQWRWK